MKKKLLPLAALLVLAGCHPFKTQVYEDNLAMALEQDSPDSLLMSISLEYVSGGPAQEAVEAINQAIVTQAFDLESIPGGLEETAIQYRENLIDEYLSENQNLSGNEICSWEDQLDGSFGPEWKGWKNYTLSYYNYRGGAHAITTVTCLVFDAKTGALLSEADLFQEGYQKALKPLLDQAIRQYLQEDVELLPLVDMEAVAPNGNFYLGKEGVTWVFQPYEIGPYALGILSPTISWTDLKPYLLK